MGSSPLASTARQACLLVVVCLLLAHALPENNEGQVPSAALVQRHVRLHAADEQGKEDEPNMTMSSDELPSNDTHHDGETVTSDWLQEVPEYASSATAASTTGAATAASTTGVPVITEKRTRVIFGVLGLLCLASVLAAVFA
eukprot:CAMPEP_0175475170 /NCGR_PEP_ID=MMETSP0095-20121207/75271_1 /TAXON_ID=311494 /ORGANISM="Alexandrium monilatum, Strain CCMP3105" /LENGTH=141 /DNA_ID=CAMNT_0016776713 /DNA_START=6 /DNA_END=427 /DNA_ORIENTATION=+